MAYVVIGVGSGANNIVGNNFEEGCWIALATLVLGLVPKM